MRGLFGVDGCRGAWIAASREPDGQLRVERITGLGELRSPRVIAIDIPIGLPEAGGRRCDLEARAVLGARRSSIFPAPIRPMLDAATRAEAAGIGRAVDGRSISAQAWAIVPKIREIDAVLRADRTLRRIVAEVHPEVIFFEMSPGAPLASKKSPIGAAQRVALLVREFGASVTTVVSEAKRLRCASDDIVDAIACLWTASRIANGTARTRPGDPPRDACGLPMRIVA
jgi:predicted RNase H-like nuclease